MDSNSAFLSSILKREDITDIPKELWSLIKSVKSDPSSWGNVMKGLRDYIWDKKLFDPYEMKIICKGDVLAKIVGAEEFTILEIKQLLESLAFRLRSSDVLDKHPPETMCKDIPIPFREAAKRKAEEELFEGDKETEKRHCEHGVECSETLSVSCAHLKLVTSPMLLHMPPSPIESASDSCCESVQNVETSVVTDSSDDEVYFEQDPTNKSQFLPSGSILTFAETFELEFEPNSESDSLCSDSDSSDWDSIMDMDSILTFVCKTDEDQEFWADHSSDEDQEFSVGKSSEEDLDDEISESDRWRCSRCKRFNNPPNRFCQKCFGTREGWLPEKPVSEKISMKRKPRSKRKKRLHKNSSKYFKDSSKPLGLPSTSQEKSLLEDFNPNKYEILLSSPLSKISDHKSNLDKKKVCIVCCDKPVDSCIIHGKLGHSICCFQCAKRFRRCPVCRRTIEKVVYLIS